MLINGQNRITAAQFPQLPTYTQTISVLAMDNGADDMSRLGTVNWQQTDRCVMPVTVISSIVYGYG